MRQARGGPSHSRLEHRLTGGVADGLRQPTEEEVVSKQLDNGLRLAHASNPAAKSPQKLIHWMKYQQGLQQDRVLWALQRLL